MGRLGFGIGIGILLGTVALTGVACKGSGGSSTPGTGGSAAGTAGSGAAGTPGTGGGAGATATAGTTGTAGAASTAGATGTAGASAGSGGGGTAGGATAGSGGGSGGGPGGRGGSGGGAAGTGGAGTGGAAGDPCATALFCDDFEKYTAGQAPGAPWTRQVSTGSTAAVDTTQFHSGTKSVKFVAASGSGSKTAYIRLMGTGSGLPVMPNMFYGRMMFRLEAAPTGDVHWTFLEGSGLIAGQTYHALYRYGGQHPVMNGSTFVGSQLMANYETPDSYSGNGPSSDCWKHSNKIVVPEGKWSCAEWQFDGTTNAMRFWLDGAAVDSLTVMGAGEGCGTATPVWTAPTFDRMDLGWESYQMDSARTIWIDDVVLSKTKVGCP
jgi:hypothetical protein